jgi:hypothetical protein
MVIVFKAKNLDNTVNLLFRIDIGTAYFGRETEGDPFDA